MPAWRRRRHSADLFQSLAVHHLLRQRREMARSRPVALERI